MQSFYFFSQDRQKIDCKENGLLTSFRVEFKVENESKKNYLQQHVINK